MIEAEFITRAIRNDEHWKAKERLQGKLSQNAYDPDLFESYGYVLLAMRDTMEAGKYLFLSGVREPDYLAAIEAYLSRYSNRDIRHIYHTFPKAAQAAPFAAYPKTVIDELAARGFKAKDVRKRLRGRPENGPSANLGIPGTIMVVVVVALLIGFLVSAVRGLLWVYHWITG